MNDVAPTLPSLADGLPPEIAAAISAEWRANEAAYWSARSALLPEHVGRWIAFADGKVVVSGTSAVEVLHAAAALPGRPFVVRVGAEREPCRMRRAPVDSGGK